MLTIVFIIALIRAVVGQFVYDNGLADYEDYND